MEKLHVKLRTAWANVSKLHIQSGLTGNSLQMTWPYMKLPFPTAEATNQMNDFLAQYFKASHPKGEGEFPLPGLSPAPRTHISDASNSCSFLYYEAVDKMQ